VCQTIETSGFVNKISCLFKGGFVKYIVFDDKNGYAKDIEFEFFPWGKFTENSWTQNIEEAFDFENRQDADFEILICSYSECASKFGNMSVIELE
jgi:hypothetical protein